MIYALDTNTLSYAFRGEGRVAERLLEHPPSEVALPAVVLYELEVGLAKRRVAAAKRSAFDRLIETLTILPFREQEARVAAEIRTQLERIGAPIGPLDNVIAATAVSHDAVLVTRNLREFGRVERLRVENWY